MRQKEKKIILNESHYPLFSDLLCAPRKQVSLPFLKGFFIIISSPLFFFFSQWQIIILVLLFPLVENFLETRQNHVLCCKLLTEFYNTSIQNFDQSNFLFFFFFLSFFWSFSFFLHFQICIFFFFFQIGSVEFLIEWATSNSQANVSTQVKMFYIKLLGLLPDEKNFVIFLKYFLLILISNEILTFKFFKDIIFIIVKC